MNVIEKCACFLFVSALVFGAPDQAEGQGGSPIIVALPSKCSEETAKTTSTLMISIAEKVPPKTPVTFYDSSGKRIANFTVDRDNQNSRVRASATARRAIAEFLEKAKADQAAMIDQLDLPALRSSLADIRGTASGPVRLLLVGTPYRTDERDAGGTFAPGEVPASEHLEVSELESPFGTRTTDQRKPLADMQVYWLLVSDPSSTREKTAVRSFWASWFDRLGGALCTYSTSPDDVLDRLWANNNDRVETAPLISGGEQLRIVKLAALNNPPPPAPPVVEKPQEKPLERPADVKKEINVSASISFVCDGSSSNGVSLQASEKLSVELADQIAKLSPEFWLSITIHRGTSFNSTFGRTRMERSESQDSAGVMALKSFIDTPSVKAVKSKTSNGETSGEQIGETFLVKPFEPLRGYVNLEEGMTKGIAQLKNSGATRSILIVIGDAATSEFDRADGISHADQESDQRLHQAVTDYLARSPDARIVMIYSGPAEGSAGFTETHADAVCCFKSLAALAGDRGIYSEGVEKMPELTRRAILNSAE
jgi:hypothetical protein